MQTRCLGGFSVKWVPKFLLPSKRIRIFGPKTTQFGPKLLFLVSLGPDGRLVGGRGARAVSRKTPIYLITIKVLSR